MVRVFAVRLATLHAVRVVELLRPLRRIDVQHAVDPTRLESRPNRLPEGIDALTAFECGIATVEAHAHSTYASRGKRTPINTRWTK